MPKVIKKRIEKKSTHEGDIKGTVEDIRERLGERQRTLVYALIVFGVLVLTVGGIFIYNKVSTSKAAELQYEGTRLFYGDTQAAQFMAPADRYKNALEKFKQSYATKKSPVTLLYIAGSHYELRNYDEAIKSLKDLTSRYSDQKIVPLAYYKLAMAYTKKGDMNSALTTFNSLAGIKDSPLQDLALFEGGKLLEATGKPAEAKAKYKELVDKFPKSALVNEAKARLVQL